VDAGTDDGGTLAADGALADGCGGVADVDVDGAAAGVPPPDPRPWSR
jgi:hypothetical protein